MVDLERGSIGRVAKSLPVLREKKMIITTEENYQKNEVELSKGDDFIVFRPWVFKVKSKDVIREKDFEDKVGLVLEREHCYFQLNSNIGYMVLNRNEEGFNEIKDRLVE